MRKYFALLFGWLLLLNGQFVFGQSAQTVAAAKKEGGKAILYTPAAGYTGEDSFTYTVDGVLQATVDTYRSSTQYRSVVWRQAYPSTVTKTIRVVALATSGRPRVDLDAFAVLK